MHRNTFFLIQTVLSYPTRGLAPEFRAPTTMTEYWVSQGKKWCEYCKVFIANNAASLRNHEVGQRHKKSMAEKLAQIRKDNIAKEKEKEKALKEQERLEQKAKKEREKAAAEKRANPPKDPEEWVYDEKSGYHFNAATGYYYDPNSGLYYSEILGKWTTQEEAQQASQKASAEASKAKALLLPTKGKASSLEVKKRKVVDKPGNVSKEEAAALAAREAAKKRVLDREKSLMGLYQAY